MLCVLNTVPEVDVDDGKAFYFCGGFNGLTTPLDLSHLIILKTHHDANVIPFLSNISNSAGSRRNVAGA